MVRASSPYESAGRLLARCACSAAPRIPTVAWVPSATSLPVSLAARGPGSRSRAGLGCVLLLKLGRRSSLLLGGVKWVEPCGFCLAAGSLSTLGETGGTSSRDFDDNSLADARARHGSVALASRYRHFKHLCFQRSLYRVRGYAFPTAARGRALGV